MGIAGADRNRGLTRRGFLQGSAKVAAAAGVFTLVPRHVLGGPGQKPPSERLNIAGIGIGGRGLGDLKSLDGENVVALCDVDTHHAAGAFKAYPDAHRHTDFRKMLDAEKEIDAVVVATPDHLHAVISIAAMKMGKHVYCEKPMAHTVQEVRAMQEAARTHKVATQMGNQGNAGEGVRLIEEWILDGAIGPVREVHAWTNKPVWPQGIDRPQDKPPVPATLDWDLWLGPAPERPYHSAYLPFTWRGWWDFGSCSLGDMGCHVLNNVVRPLKLGAPTSVEAYATKVNAETGPLASTIYYQFPPRGNMPPLRLTWYDGGMMPPRPEELEPDRRMGDNEGVLFVGDKGKITCSCYGDGPRIIPESKMRAYRRPPKTIPRSIGHHKEWVAACKGGPPAGSNFEAAGPLTEIVLLGNVAIRAAAGQPQNGRPVKIEWDAPNMTIPNRPEANRFLSKTYRKGWGLQST
ncbi:MAG TPA: Gfo/Idh/MocA family oxidoreductase [Phycisphaerae bacterium]|nr:Gfo/Idh/MocA family oxidoreductase [Phycisphaerae bacterium]